MVMEVIKISLLIRNNWFALGREVALFVKDKYIAELVKLQSFKNRDYATALKESFIKIDELLRTP